MWNPRAKLYTPKEESLRIPMKRIDVDVTSTTHASLDVLLDGERIFRCMDRLHKIHFVKRKAT